jgi:hypothetical protein
MRDVLEEMTHQVANSFLRLKILLAAMRTVTFSYRVPAVQTGLIVTKMMSGH